MTPSVPTPGGKGASPKDPTGTTGTTGTTKQPPPTKRVSASDARLRGDIARVYQYAGSAAVSVGMVKRDAGLVGTGTAAVNQAEELADAWMLLADRNPKVKAVLVQLTEVSAVGAVVGLHVTILTPFLVDRGILPRALFGPPEAVNNGDGGHPDV